MLYGDQTAILLLLYVFFRMRVNPRGNALIANAAVSYPQAELCKLRLRIRERNTVHAQNHEHSGDGGTFIAVGERVVPANRERHPRRFLRDGRVQFIVAEALIAVQNRRFEQRGIADAGQPARRGNELFVQRGDLRRSE
jgi:hypothetical protein